MSMGWDIISSEDITSSNAWVRGHGGRLQIMLWIVQGVCAVCTIDTTIADPTTVVMRGSIQASLRVTVVSILIAHKEVI